MRGLVFSLGRFQDRRFRECFARTVLRKEGPHRAEASRHMGSVPQQDAVWHDAVESKSVFVYKRRGTRGVRGAREALGVLRLKNLNFHLPYHTTTLGLFSS